MPRGRNAAQGTLFEEDYLIRTLGPIATNADIALTELVANAWDAGATLVDLTIPDATGSTLTIADDGSGMTREQFHTRWMTLGYNRLKHQGAEAEFPPERATSRRPAYGRNGVGRHGLLCFADQYEVRTRRKGAECTFTVATSKGKDPFKILHEASANATGHGTILEVTVERHRPDADRIRDVLSARFLHDPGFGVAVNGRSVPLAAHVGLIDHRRLEVTPEIIVDAYFVDATSAGRTTRHQGIAFWIGGRLVGTPSWMLGNRSVIDGRTTLAKRYTVVVKSDALFDEVLSDWTGFKASPLVDQLCEAVAYYVSAMFKQLSHERVRETKETVLRDHRAEIETLQPLAQLEVAAFVEAMADEAYTMAPETFSLAVQTVIKLEKSKSGAALLEKLTQLTEGDIEGLDRLLGEWSVRDALTVLDEVDRRLAVVEALAKLSADKSVDELKTLHPLVTQARWLFGPEFESAEYASNVTLRTAVEKVFKERIDKTAFENSRKRPDLLVLADATLSAVAIDEMDSEAGLTRMREVLLIELKRGGFVLDRKEVDQANGYVEDILSCGLLESQPYIRAYVIGHECRPTMQSVRRLGDKVETAIIRVCTYSQLVRTAEQRLFRLRDRLRDRYEGGSGSELLDRLHAEPRQMTLAPNV
jgi:hypothetical protein